VSTVPARAQERARLVEEAGADVLVVQGTVLTARHRSTSYHQLSFVELCRTVSIPVVVGNCVQYATALELMATGVAACWSASARARPAPPAACWASACPR